MHILAIEEYGLRCLLQVAFHPGPGPMTAPEIARAEGLGPEYVAKIMRTLRMRGLVVSTRGAAGGYRLARPADQIGVWGGRSRRWEASSSRRASATATPGGVESVCTPRTARSGPCGER